MKCISSIQKSKKINLALTEQTKKFEQEMEAEIWEYLEELRLAEEKQIRKEPQEGKKYPT